jgi:hypothetical protein
MWTVFMIASSLDVGHARHAALFADVRRHALQRHHRLGSRIFGDLCLLRIGDVHDHATLEHLRQSHFQSKLLARKLKHIALLFLLTYTIAGEGS